MPTFAGRTSGDRFVQCETEKRHRTISIIANASPVSTPRPASKTRSADLSND